MPKLLRVNQACPNPNKLGDSALMEPALHALARRDDRRIALHVCFDNGHDELYFKHPTIAPVPCAWDEPDLTVDAVAALRHAERRVIPFGAAFFPPLLGREAAPTGRVHYEAHWLRKPPLGIAADPGFAGKVLIAHNSHSCRSRDKDTGLLRPGVAPDQQPPLGWWSDVLPHLPPAVGLRGTKDPWDLPLPGAEDVRGLSILGLLLAMRSARLLISVETGVLHLAAAAGVPTVYLSSCTHPTLCGPPGRCRVVRADRADRFDPSEVVSAARELL